MMTPTEFSSLRAFVAVAQALSFSRAAAVLGLSPSAVSQTIRALEDRLGEQLFNRTTRSVSLTEAGRRLLDRVGPAMAWLSAAAQDIASGKEQPMGAVRVHAFRLAAELFLTPLTGKYTV